MFDQLSSTHFECVRNSIGDERRPDGGLVSAPHQRLRCVVEAAVAGVFAVNPEHLGARGRGVARISRARQVAMYLAHITGRLTLTEVGSLFHRDRTTVAHACAVIEDARDDPEFDRIVSLLEKAVPLMALRHVVL